jgi:hypothetical protein
MVMRKRLLATLGWRSTWVQAQLSVTPVRFTSGRLMTMRCTSRTMRGGLPNSTASGMSTGCSGNNVSLTRSCGSVCAWPTTANGQRSRAHSAANASSDSGAMAST